MLIRDEVVTLTGSRHLEGISKSGKPYSFDMVSFLDDDFNIIEAMAGTEVQDFTGMLVPCLLQDQKGQQIVVDLELKPRASGGMQLFVRKAERKQN